MKYVETTTEYMQMQMLILTSNVRPRYYSHLSPFFHPSFFPFLVLSIHFYPI